MADIKFDKILGALREERRITKTQTSATIPAGQEIDCVIDEFDNTYRYKVLTDGRRNTLY